MEYASLLSVALKIAILIAMPAAAIMHAMSGNWEMVLILAASTFSAICAFTEQAR